MARRLFTLPTTLSLVLLAVVCLLWVRSLHVQGDPAGLRPSRGNPALWLTSGDGRAALCYESIESGGPPTNPLRGFNVLGIQLAGFADGGGSRWNLYVPYSLLAVLSTVPAAAGAARTARRGRAL